MPHCDVCNCKLEYADGYALTTRQVVCNDTYWEYLLDNRSFDDELLNLTIQQQAGQRSGWLLCLDCSLLFAFDRVQAQEDAERQVSPQGSGPVDFQIAAVPAIRAWRKKYGHMPTWVLGRG